MLIAKQIEAWRWHRRPTFGVSENWWQQASQPPINHPPQQDNELFADTFQVSRTFDSLGLSLPGAVLRHVHVIVTQQCSSNLDAQGISNLMCCG